MSSNPKHVHWASSPTFSDYATSESSLPLTPPVNDTVSSSIVTTGNAQGHRNDIPTPPCPAMRHIPLPEVNLGLDEGNVIGDGEFIQYDDDTPVFKPENAVGLYSIHQYLAEFPFVWDLRKQPTVPTNIPRSVLDAPAFPHSSAAVLDFLPRWEVSGASRFDEKLALSPHRGPCTIGAVLRAVAEGLWSGYSMGLLAGQSAAVVADAEAARGDRGAAESRGDTQYWRTIDLYPPGALYFLGLAAAPPQSDGVHFVVKASPTPPSIR